MIQTSAANFSLNNSKKVRRLSRGGSWWGPVTSGSLSHGPGGGSVHHSRPEASFFGHTCFLHRCQLLGSGLWFAERAFSAAVSTTALGEAGGVTCEGAAVPFPVPVDSP